MKRLSAFALASAIILLFSILAFSRKPKAVPHQPSSNTTKPDANRQAVYYWYFEPGDIYNDQNTLSAEETEMWIYYDGTLINTVPLGGTLIEEGFHDNSYPHDYPPYYHLYAHFDN